MYDKSVDPLSLFPFWLHFNSNFILVMLKEPDTPQGIIKEVRCALKIHRGGLKWEWIMQLLFWCLLTSYSLKQKDENESPTGRNICDVCLFCVWTCQWIFQSSMLSSASWDDRNTFRFKSTSPCRQVIMNHEYMLWVMHFFCNNNICSVSIYSICAKFSLLLVLEMNNATELFSLLCSM